MIYDSELEQRLLGALVMQPTLFAKIESKISEDDFYFQENQQAFRFISGNTEGVDPISFKTFCKNNLPSFDYVGTLHVADVVMFDEVVKGFLTLAKRRRTSETISSALMQLESGGNIDQIKDFIENHLSEIKSDNPVSEIEDISSYLDESLANSLKSKEKQFGIKTGFPSLDGVTSGFENGNLIIIASRPGMGKSALGICMALKSSKLGNKIVMFSLEMSKLEMGNRMLGIEASISSKKFTDGSINQSEYNFVKDSLPQIKELGIKIDDESRISILGVKRKIKSYMKKQEVSLVIIDHLHIMGVPDKKSLSQELGELAQGLKDLAKELNVPIVVMAQLNREIDKRAIQRPQLSDLKDSSGIEAAANIVMFIHREEYYLKQKEPSKSNYEDYQQWQKKMHEAKGKAELIIEKNRNGPTGNIELEFDGEFIRFSDPYFTDNNF